MKFWIGLVTVLLLGMGIILYKQEMNQNAEFTLKKVQFDFPYHPEWEIASLPKEEQEHLNHIFSQSFTYLGKGARALSFLSEDGQYVLKFFKYRYHQPHWSVRFLPAIFPFESYRKRKMQKVSLETVLNGYKVAYDYDRQGTGLLYIHLNPTADQHLVVNIIDKQGQSHAIDLDGTRFIVQRKVRELEELLDALLQKQEVDLAQQRICQVFDLYFSFYQKGVCDLGIGILRNNGFIGDEPIHFDVGKMIVDTSMRDPKNHRARTLKMAKKVKFWLFRNYPQYESEISHKLQIHLSEVYGEITF